MRYKDQVSPKPMEVTTKTQRYHIDGAGRRHGSYSEWYPNGHILIYTEYVRGRPHGKYLEWFENYQPRVYAEYVNGKKHGEFKQWYQNDQLALHYQFLNGNLHGENRAWLANGQYCLRSFYRDGVLLENVSFPTDWKGRVIFRLRYGKLPLLNDGKSK